MSSVPMPLKKSKPRPCQKATFSLLRNLSWSYWRKGFVVPRFVNYLNFYRPQRSWGKVIFLQASVILFTGGVCLSACWVPDQAGITSPGAEYTGRNGQQVGGMHPTGMQSCSVFMIRLGLITGNDLAPAKLF